MTAYLAELNRMLDPIRAGDRNAAVDWLQILLPGTSFLIRRRLGKLEVEAEARTVLDEAFRKVESNVLVTAEKVPGLIRRLICQRYPAKSNEDTGTSNVEAKAAERVLNKMSPLERDALRRCYVLGETPEAIVRGLRLTLEDFRSIRSRARAEFRASKPKKANVA